MVIFLFRHRHERYVSHFPLGTGLSFSVNMDENAFARLTGIRIFDFRDIRYRRRLRIPPVLFERLIDDPPSRLKVLPENVFHQCRCFQFRSGQCLPEEEVAEFRVLRCGASFYSIVSAVVRPRCHFIEYKLITFNKEFYGKYSFIITSLHEVFTGTDYALTEFCRDFPIFHVKCFGRDWQTRTFTVLQSLR